MNFIPIYKVGLVGNEKRYVEDCLESTWISSQGKYIELFEDAFAKFCGTKYAIAVSNGTVAIHLALVCLGVGKNDEVIIPDLTFVATANAVTYVQAKPIPVDCELNTWNIDPKRIEEKITTKTKAIIVVHLYGYPCNMGEISKIAKKYGIPIVEDAAEAHGAKYLETRVGSIGEVGCFSFYGNKVITTGEGGMIVTNNSVIAEKARFLKDHAMSKERRYFHPEIGFNYRMTNIQAAIGLAQLEKVEEILDKKRIVATKYFDLLKANTFIDYQHSERWATNIYWMVSILLNNNSRIKRDELAREMYEKNIDSRPFFVPIHELPAFEQENRKFPVAVRLSLNGINLPSYPSITDGEISYICQTISELCQK